ncbi:MAG: hypothetical protein GYA31_02080 [Parcubacteria group bacterium]|nr:hypothetical protein [Parcubacteria group bacterium]
MDTQKDFSKIIAKINELKSGKNPLDLSSKEDLAVGIMNLISIEEHLFFTYNKTGDQKYLDILNQTREIRKNLLKEIVKDPKGEIWCISKHLLALSMRLMEVGTKKLSDGETAKAKELFDKSYLFWNIFWGLNLGIINTKDINNKDNDPKESETITLLSDNKEKKFNIFSRLSEIIQQVLDCCKE